MSAKAGLAPRVVVHIDVTDLHDAERDALFDMLDKFGVDADEADDEHGEEPSFEGWTKPLLDKFLVRLEARKGAAAQAEVFKRALTDGPVSRTETLAVLGRSGSDPVTGFRKPVKAVWQQMVNSGEIPPDAPIPLYPEYDPAKKGFQRATAFYCPPGLRALVA